MPRYRFTRVQTKENWADVIADDVTDAKVKLLQGDIVDKGTIEYGDDETLHCRIIPEGSSP